VCVYASVRVWRVCESACDRVHAHAGVRVYTCELNYHLRCVHVCNRVLCASLTTSECACVYCVHHFHFRCVLVSGLAMNLTWVCVCKCACPLNFT
jgi:hypothetical protein